ncbi:unnamed protein product [Owenia fusiformis]|uniref:Uncharacterized protein n=1 Tax=Owenia fusiformis TaxID=6347 RepID=A0A8J1XNU3_OWEFU|nr:unnamed protein product [Owenia fusiformis]
MSRDQLLKGSVNMEVHLRPMTHDDLKMATTWETMAGWTNDYCMREMLFELYGDSHEIAETEDGEAIGFTSPNVISQDLAFLETIFIREDFRGKQIGKYLMNKMMDTYSDRNFWLNADTGKEGFYQKLGFKVGAKTAKCTGNVSEDVIERVKDDGAFKTDGSTVTTEPAGEKLFKDLKKFEMTTLNISRQSFFEKWFESELHKPICALARDKDGVVIGYALCRRLIYETTSDVTQSYVINPLVADDGRIANRLFRNIYISLPIGSKITFKSPNYHGGVERLVGKFNLEVESQGTAMFSKDLNPIDFSKIYSFFPY